ncbi:PLP-dependent aminotransferase family protein [Clostridium swellfunianum]|uniref:MocR-like pyridoxine biosynthesis transcription factor PdxR n=1 Tax=Clostridium swellfunianum TaxID=1367462 RepID=UPI00202F545D|nr:PLP-dependent aminotransferase family protein [Clostridium swellfunianum]MCM0650553.1 PLP-dependent aminotransferase family protein [Clostridium swellfunianum]
MEKYNIKLCQGDIPKYIQITRYIKKLIDSNAIEDGEKLPPIRVFSDFLGVNNDTIINAYRRLQHEGYAVQKIGSGTYAKKREINRTFKKDYSDTFKKLSGEAIKDYIDFTGENACGDFFPVTTFKNVLNEVLDRDGAGALAYQELLGYKGLRESINKYFWGNTLDSDNILIVSGAQQGIDIASKALININDNVLVEKPTYSGALSVFKGRRANIFEADIKEDGIDIMDLKNILKKNKIKCFYLMSYFQNPTGCSYSIEKKREILRLAEEYDFYIIEDDYLSELIYDPNLEYKSFKALDTHDRVIYIKSFSKIFLPGIRIGYLICPDRFKEQLQNSKLDTDIATSSLMQRALQLYIEKGFWREYINQLNIIYNERYNHMQRQLEQVLGEKVEFIKPGGGLNFYIKLKEAVKTSSIKLFYDCKEQNVLITPGVLFYKNSKDGESFFRLGFSKAEKHEIDKGLNVINNILKASDRLG